MVSTEINNKTISFDTLAISETGEYVWEMRLKEVRDESGTDIKADYAIEYYLTNNYFLFVICLLNSSILSCKSLV